MVSETLSIITNKCLCMSGESQVGHYNRLKNWIADHHSLSLAIATAMGFCIGWGGLFITTGDNSLSYQAFTVMSGGLVAGLVYLILDRITNK